MGSLLLLAVGSGGGAFLIYQQIKVRTLGLNMTRVALGDPLLLAPIIAGVTGLLQPRSPFPFMLIAIATSAGFFVLFSQSWALVLHSVLDSGGPYRSKPHSGQPFTPPRGRQDTDPRWSSAIPAQTGPSTEDVVARRVEATEIRPM
jgi:hypothetical protein